MIIQGVGHPVLYLGVWYANDPQKGGYMAHAPAFDLTPLFEVILGILLKIHTGSTPQGNRPSWVMHLPSVVRGYF